MPEAHSQTWLDRPSFVPLAYSAEHGLRRENVAGRRDRQDPIAGDDCELVADGEGSMRRLSAVYKTMKLVEGAILKTLVGDCTEAMAQRKGSRP
jgi:hypothetical protein